MRLPKTLGLVSTLVLACAGAGAIADDGPGKNGDDFHRIQTATPIKHLVVIFQENISFDHYFGTYPSARNLSGETPFKASPRTPLVNNLVNPLDVEHDFKPLKGVDLLNKNPNANPANPVSPVPPLTGGVANKNGAGASNPFRLSPLQALTADQGHNESPEESAYDNGKMDGFPAFTGTAGPPPAGIGNKGLVMAYFDGNTTTALWNYAQHFAMSDNSYGSQFGPSSPGAINLISGQTNGFAATLNVIGGSNQLLHTTHEAFADASQSTNNLTLVGDADPLQDVC
jgi:phospholipase C